MKSFHCKQVTSNTRK